MVRVVDKACLRPTLCLRFQHSKSAAVECAMIRLYNLLHVAFNFNKYVEPSRVDICPI